MTTIRISAPLESAAAMAVKAKAVVDGRYLLPAPVVLVSAVKTDTEFSHTNTTSTGTDVPGLSATFTVPDSPFAVIWQLWVEVQNTGATGSVLVRYGTAGEDSFSSDYRAAANNQIFRDGGDVVFPMTGIWTPTPGSVQTVKLQTRTSVGTSFIKTKTQNQGAFGKWFGFIRVEARR